MCKITNPELLLNSGEKLEDIDLAHSLDNGKTFRDLCLALLQESVKIQLGRSFKKFTVTSLDYTQYRFIRNGV